MFGLFGKKAKEAKAATTVAPEVGATLQAQTTPPAASGAAKPAFPACELAHVQGVPPNATWAARETNGQTRRAFRVPASAKAPALALLSSAGEDEQLQVWELSSDKDPRFVRQRSVALDPGQKDWFAVYPLAVTCLPANQAAVVVSYNDPRPRENLYVYDTVAGSFRSLGRVAPDRTHGPPYVYTESLALTPDAMLLLYYTDEVRLGAEDYAPQYNRIVLFSPRYRQGLEILKLHIDDGNVRGWVATGKRLWLETEDKRSNRKFLWSLDLDNVL